MHFMFHTHKFLFSLFSQINLFTVKHFNIESTAKAPLHISLICFKYRFCSIVKQSDKTFDFVAFCRSCFVKKRIVEVVLKTTIKLKVHIVHLIIGEVDSFHYHFCILKQILKQYSTYDCISKGCASFHWGSNLQHQSLMSQYK